MADLGDSKWVAGLRSGVLLNDEVKLSLVFHLSAKEVIDSPEYGELVKGLGKSPFSSIFSGQGFAGCSASFGPGANQEQKVEEAEETDSVES